MVYQVTNKQLNYLKNLFQFLGKVNIYFFYKKKTKHFFIHIKISTSEKI